MFTVGLIRRIVGVAAAAVPIFLFAQSVSDVQVSARAKRLHDRAIVVDTHDDTPQRLLFDKTFNIGMRNKDGHVDIPRMREGGLDALFFSIWVPSQITGPPAVKRALDLIDSVREAVRTHPNDLMLANTAADIRRAAAEHKIAALMGMEGGHIIDDDLAVLRVYAALGVRYLTLTHFLNNNWADSSTDKPSDLQSSPQYDRRHDARACEKRRRGHDQLRSSLSERGVPSRERKEKRQYRRGDVGDVEEVRWQ